MVCSLLITVMRNCLQTKNGKEFIKKWILYQLTNLTEIINCIWLANNKAMESDKKLSISNNAIRNDIQVSQDKFQARKWSFFCNFLINGNVLLKIILGYIFQIFKKDSSGNQYSDCVFILIHRKGYFCLQRILGHSWGYGSTILCCEYYAGRFCQVTLSPYLKMLYFTSEDENSSEQKLERKWHDILATCKEIIYIDIGYKSTSDEKIVKIRRLPLSKLFHFESNPWH